MNVIHGGRVYRDLGTDDIHVVIGGHRLRVGQDEVSDLLGYYNARRADNFAASQILNHFILLMEKYGAAWFTAYRDALREARAT